MFTSLNYLNYAKYKLLIHETGANLSMISMRTLYCSHVDNGYVNTWAYMDENWNNAPDLGFSVKCSLFYTGDRRHSLVIEIDW